MIEITAVSAFDDNYIWVLKNPASSQAIAVDPGDETPVLQWLEQISIQLSAILITHRHYDHVGGIPELCDVFPGIAVFGPGKEKIRGVTHPLKEGDKPSIPGLAADFQVLEVPGHTAGHIAYYGEGVLFCGDALFAGGCGRVFDGTFEQLSASLQRIAQLPAQTRLYCAHEYTLANLGFAEWVEPDNSILKKRIEVEQVKRHSAQPTVPSLLLDELQTNPFLRTSEPSVISAAELATGTKLSTSSQIFTALRQWKDREYD
ncbi:MAG: hydroxyacylglutathione hydrolase [Candidatus Thiodiazotropha sp. (ex Lucinoma aequizonata)]|nr:hydroxyacylglutathione hydrolase [Candidatus Thiodiazotropha sp. (ex Lucinoma aequizonata)]MCU7887519.1 hydroxyacylglutathione hydrolase [Candidatus Thiodiazotropha sp. (ex Lucinoma aequizonata)]MCU7896240.1 hydroxyacylglutathione hydrolase [Candidatus Thiodiazotropha sp. (ex Lucinoma aequizonata)]MCU7899006.1 hydroxyacylglutathione hydrolase [Candidatus Thiodiazotropha sp. (ex Lucinoma aequizonata)]MCU7904028.1 hydroxyacylglutathione hydrolase [Candidatus Thiodiazotropha sp. (ex Lucinoma ae